MDAVGGIFDRVIENVEDGGAEVFGDGSDVQAHPERDGCELNRLDGEVITLERDRNAVGNQWGKFQQHTILIASRTQFAGLENLLDGAEEAVGVGEHDLVKLLALDFRNFAALEGFEVEANGGDGSLELVGNCVEEGILALVAANLANQEDGVQNDAGSEQGEEDHAKDDGGDASFVEDDPGDVVRDQATDEQHSKRDREGDGTASSVHVHGVKMSIVGLEVRRWIGEIC